MNQQKTGEFLKRLRKEKGLTQEQLAEQFYVSSRTVSRWETGSNLPDVSTLIELADYYEVDIRELINGERKSEIMDKETKDTLLKVADYAAEGEKRTQLRVVHVVLGVCVALLVVSILFVGEVKGLLYGIVPEEICNYILVFVYGLASALLVAYIKARWALETPTNEPERTVRATVTSKEIVSGTHGAGRSKLGYSFLIHFTTADGQLLDIFAYEEEYARLHEHTTGTLTYRGPYFVDFEPNA